MIKEILQEGFILKSRGFYKHAIEAFYKALEIDNSSLELLLEIADLYYLMGNIERSIEYIEQILDKEPTHIESLKLLKKIFEDKKAWQEAEQTAKNIYCISNAPEDLAEIFKLLNKQGRFNEIFEYSFEVSSAEVLYELAWARFLNREYEKAEEIINRVLGEKQDDKSLLLKGKILFKLNKKSECREILNRIEINNPDVLNFAGLIEQYEKNYKKAISYFLEAIKLVPSEDEYYYNCASTYFKMDEIGLAKKYYNLAISINPENDNYHFALANLYYSEKHYKRALAELTSDFFEARLLKSIILYDTGYLALAKKELIELSSIQPDNFIVNDYKNRIEEELKI